MTISVLIWLCYHGSSGWYLANCTLTYPYEIPFYITEEMGQRKSVHRHLGRKKDQKLWHLFYSSKLGILHTALNFIYNVCCAYYEELELSNASLRYTSKLGLR